MIRHKNHLYREAGWWDDTPLGGDGPLDQLGVMEEQENPEAGLLLLSRWFASRSPDDLYGAIGVWDHVMTTGPQDWREVFQAVTREVPGVAKRALALYRKELDYPEDETPWGARYLNKYAKGASGLTRHNESFGAAWYI